MEEDNKTKYIESSLAAFRVINAFVLQEGAYPSYFNKDYWSEEEYEDPAIRLSLRKEFERRLEMLANVHNTYVKALYEAMPHIESEYDNIVINSRNMEHALKLFRDKYDKELLVIEYVMDINKALKNYLVPLQNQGIIQTVESNTYQELICNIGIYYNQAVNVVCNVFELEKPWNKNRPDVAQIPIYNTDEQGSSIDTESEIGQQSEKNGLYGINFSAMVSYKSIRDDGPNLEILYSFLIGAKVINNIDYDFFEKCITHAYFLPLYNKGNNVNILYVIRRLSDYYEADWLDAACKSIRVDKKRVTQRQPKEKITAEFPSLKLQK